jgi:hypothetical protein
MGDAACFEGRPVEAAAAEGAVAHAFLELWRPQELAVPLEGLAILAEVWAPEEGCLAVGGCARNGDGGGAVAVQEEPQHWAVVEAT